MEEIVKHSSLSSGAALRRVDLHVHTPASDDMSDAWSDATPDDVVTLALEAGLDLIAVTDHNTAQWCDSVSSAATGTDLTVLPGVEISTSEGHLLAVFDVGKPQSEIEDFLVNIGLDRKDFGKLDRLANGRIDEIAERVEAAGGLAIAAHVEREKGFWRMMEGSRTRRKEIHACESISAYEIVDPELRDQFRDGLLDGYPRPIASIQGSDCYPSKGDSHHLDAIGNRHCYVSLDQPGLTGLRMACLDPAIRIRLMKDDRPEPSAVIEGLWVSGGFLNEQIFRFNDNITCLIGDTGSGKSLTLELVRFALDQQINSKVLPDIANEVGDLLEDNLGEMDSVNVLVRKSGESYLVERTWLGVGSQSTPTVARVVDGAPQPTDDDIHVPSFFPLKGFSQTEIIEYAREPLARLSLIDDLIDLDSDQTEVQVTKDGLHENAVQTVAQMKQLEQTRAKLKGLPGIQEEIARLETFLTNEAVRRRTAWDAEGSLLDAAKESLEELEETIDTEFPELHDELLHDDDLDADTPSPDLRDQLVDLEKAVRKTLSKAEKELRSGLETHMESLKDTRSDWESRFKEADKKYQELVGELDTKERSQAKLQSQLATLKGKERSLKSAKRKINKEIQPLLEQLQEEREELLDALQATRREITRKRRKKANELSEALDKNVLIKVRSEDDGREFHRQLLELRTGSRVQESDLDQMSERMHPIPFVKSVLTKDSTKPAEEAGLAEEVITRFTDNVWEKERLDDLFELQIVDLPDIVQVQFAIEPGEYKDLERLAHGQKCTVVLMIALAEGDFPLLVDQPEDALHAPWIENYIATTLRTRRGVRQCVFATRNANVLVSADAEQVIAMKADAQHSVIDKTGALDRFETRDLVLYHVEGGEQPLRRRLQKYGLSLST